MLLREIINVYRENHTNYINMQNFLMSKEVVHTVTIELQRVRQHYKCHYQSLITTQPKL
jgi:hypothetical protein